MLDQDKIYKMDCFQAAHDIDDNSVDCIITDPPYPNHFRLFTTALLDGYAMLYLACKKAKNYVIFFWSPTDVPPPPPGWYEVARHIWHKPDCKSITHYEIIVVWSKENKRKVSRVWSIPILDYRSLRDWKPHPTQKPVKLIRYLLDLYTKEGDLVLDPFVGSGTTAVACKQTGRHYIGTDNNPEYAKIATERLIEKPWFRRQERKDAPPETNTPPGKESASPVPKKDPPEKAQRPIKKNRD